MLGEVYKFRSSLAFRSMWLYTAALVSVLHTYSRSELPRYFTQRGMVLSYRLLGQLTVPSSRVKDSSWTVLPFKMGPIGCPETSVRKCRSTLSKIAQERRSHLHRAGSLYVSCPLTVRKKCSKYQTEFKPCIVILCCQTFQARLRKHSLEGERVRVTDQVCTRSTLALTASESDSSHRRLCENRIDY
jgi:hypothetical protein